MKTGEMFMVALENPKAKFKNILNGDIYHFTKGRHLQNEAGWTYMSPKIDEDWEIVRDPVDFMTAINSGKPMKPFESNLYCRPAIFWLTCHEFTLEEINGKWHIE